MQIGGFQKFSIIDYPGMLSAIVFTQGCNFRCPYCHNPELAEFKNTQYSEELILEFLKTRIGKLDAVVITGGEPTLQKDLIDFISKIKEMGFLIKLDTNGSNPSLLGQIICHKLVDYIAMDIKAPEHKYNQLSASNISFDTIKQSINIIKKSSIPHEFRTTVVKELLEVVDIEQIAALANESAFYLQKFVPSKHIDESFNECSTYSDEEFARIKEKISTFCDKCYVR